MENNLWLIWLFNSYNALTLKVGWIAILLSLPADVLWGSFVILREIWPISVKWRNQSFYTWYFWCSTLDVYTPRPIAPLPRQTPSLSQTFYQLHMCYRDNSIVIRSSPSIISEVGSRKSQVASRKTLLGFRRNTIAWWFDQSRSYLILEQSKAVIPFKL